MANNDRVYEAYSGELGELSKAKTEKRVEWIIKNIGTGKNVLDVGCSQGIVSVLAAKNGNTVSGIDIQPEVVEFAKKIRDEKYSELTEKIEFLCLDFFEYIPEKQFDVIIMTEVLEHLEKPAEFLIHSKKFLRPNGILICSVPFGVMNHPDHKSTFYLTGIVDIIETAFSINRIDYMGKWIGFIAETKDIPNKIIYNHDVVLELENNFLEIDRELTKKNEELYIKNMEFSKKYRDSMENYAILKEKIQNEYDKLKKLTADKEKLTADKEKLTADKEKLTDMLIDIYEEINSGIQLFKENKAVISKLESQNNYLKHENAEYRRKLSMITDTFIGKLGIKVYKMLKKVKGWIR